MEKYVVEGKFELEVKAKNKEEAGEKACEKLDLSTSGDLDIDRVLTLREWLNEK